METYVQRLAMDLVYIDIIDIIDLSAPYHKGY